MVAFLRDLSPAGSGPPHMIKTILSGFRYVWDKAQEMQTAFERWELPTLAMLET